MASAEDSDEHMVQQLCLLDPVFKKIFTELVSPPNLNMEELSKDTETFEAMYPYKNFTEFIAMYQAKKAADDVLLSHYIDPESAPRVEYIHDQNVEGIPLTIIPSVDDEDYFDMSHEEKNREDAIAGTRLRKIASLVTTLNTACSYRILDLHSERHNHIRVVSPTSSTLLNPCDLLVIVEPSPFQYIEKSIHAARMVVFASHFNIKFAPGTICTNVAYIHTPDMDNLRARTKRLLELQEASVQTRNVNSIQVDAVHKVVINGHHNNPIPQGNTHVIVDLSQKTTSFGMHLAFWDAFDFMLNHSEYIEKWLICFPEHNGRKLFNQFVQNCIDALFCKTFENGNVTDIRSLLTLMPFYRSGTIDKKFQISQVNFGGIQAVTPTNAVDTCKAAAMYNLYHLAGSICRIKE
ncbi:uncharacterized protein CEXT_748901 [Caerostris extrusa]|uniref:Uncharacterized protein n=1 Tax=Caerostris extrusa TaxID=172846 RepID=A0AAV4SM14_CAEEX|nr:uncharacterized protein CEXT_748901 [Caerostris extrusa]